MLTILNTKNRVPLVIKLPQQAIAFLQAHKPEAANSTDLIFPSESGGRLLNWDRATKALQKASGTSGWHRHDLRRTGATMLGNLGYSPHVIEAALNHATIHSSLASTYNKSRYSEDVARAMQALADEYDRVMS